MPLVYTSALEGMEKLIAKRDYRAAWELITKEIEQDLGSKEELKELFSFVLTTYWYVILFFSPKDFLRIKSI